jgi:glucosamine--fructose-6-phosphate aminotransferase (isomerizing)
VCSIIGYSGSEAAAGLLVGGLRKMEYRGYDSAGVATIFDRKIWLRKSTGRVDSVNEVFHLDGLPGTIGVGHTRWATHGGVTEANAHPHLSSSGKVAIVHNGIIDNHSELRTRLTQQGYVFKSETDSEVIANLLEQSYVRSGDIKLALADTVAELKGSYAFVAIFEDGTLGAVRYHQPLVIGISRYGYYVASDILGFAEHADKAVYLDDRDVVIMNRSGLFVGNFDSKLVTREVVRISNANQGSGKKGYAHHTLKEIFDQPTTIQLAGIGYEREMSDAIDLIRGAKAVYITGSGSSLNAALAAKYLFLKHAGLSIEPIIASEARFSPSRFGPGSVLIVVSQSGESADVLEAVHMAKEKGAEIISIVNVTTSTLVRMSTISIGLNCGPEVGVAATKSYTSQLAVLCQMVDTYCGGCLGLDRDEVSRQIANVLSDHLKIKDVAKRISDVRDIFVLGRGIHYFSAMEGALKLKELTYAHAEALPGGELKHGPMALLDARFQIVVVNPFDSTYSETLLGAQEARARGAKIIGISDRPNDAYDQWIEIPSVRDDMFPFIETVPLQLLSYYLAVEREADPDYPRNLAKSVTVR